MGSGCYCCLSAVLPPRCVAGGWAFGVAGVAYVRYFIQFCVTALSPPTLSLAHIIVRYREYQRLEPNEPQEVLLAWDTVAMAIPCL